MVIFDKESHTYTDKSTNERFISVTTLISKYKPHFDADKHSARIAQREGIPQEMVREIWEKENKKATSNGTRIHKIMEQYIINGEEDSDNSTLFSSYEDSVKKSIGTFDSVLCETLLHNQTHKLAGTADLLFVTDTEFIVGDFKTNKRFNFTSNFKETFHAPVDHFMYCEFNTYALQLSFYAYMYEQLTNKRCKQLTIFYLVNNQWQAIHCNYLKSDVQKILEHYTKNTSLSLNTVNEN
jgi:ATP-dependent exoDNAse (exonuclease V) beta subunit